jgi:hypothetical protein
MPVMRLNVGDVRCCETYDGDGKADIAVYRNGNGLFIAPRMEVTVGWGVAQTYRCSGL